MSAKNKKSAIVSAPDAAANVSASAASDVGLNSDNMLILIEKITTAFSTSFNTCIDRIVDAIDKKLSHRLDCQSTEIFDVNKRIDRLEQANKHLESDNNLLKDQISQLTAKCDSLSLACDDLEQYSRNSNLLIHGVLPISQGTTEDGLTDHVVDLLNKYLGTTIQGGDLSAVHRIGRSTPTASSTHPKPLPIIVQFVNRKSRNQVLSLRKNLKGKGFSITEQLTARKALLLKKAAEYVANNKVQAAWSHEGRVLVKSLTNRTIVIHSETELSKLN
jgi:hypothetical protein